MSDITIDLLDAKLEAAEARTEARVARLETLVENSIKNSERAIADFREESKTTRRTIVITGISSVFAIVFGVAAFNATLLSNMLDSFGMGKDARDTIKLEVATQNKEMTTKYEEMSGKYEEMSSKYEEMSGKYTEMSGKLDDLTKAVNQLISAHVNSTIAPH